MKVLGSEPVSVKTDRAAAWAPASLSNLGPGFDVLGIAFDAWGDRVEAVLTDKPGLIISYSTESVWKGVCEPHLNTAGVAASRILDILDYQGGIELIIKKNIAPGSGVGSSASSAVAAAWAINLLFDKPLEKKDLVRAVLAGESIASGSEHGDNVISSLLGGMVIVSSSDPSSYRRIRIDESLTISIVLPSVQILTRAARALLPEMVPFSEAVRHSSSLAMLIDALKDGDWRAVGKHIMQDRMVEPLRGRLLSCYDAIKRAALDAGAYGCALSGSGPAMFAISEDSEESDEILSAMIRACENAGIEATGTVTIPDNDGVREWMTPDIA